MKKKLLILIILISTPFLAKSQNIYPKAIVYEKDTGAFFTKKQVKKIAVLGIKKDYYKKMYMKADSIVDISIKTIDSIKKESEKKDKINEQINAKNKEICNDEKKQIKKRKIGRIVGDVIIGVATGIMIGQALK